MGGTRSISERLSSQSSAGDPQPSDQVNRGKRERILGAITQLVAERGYEKTTIEAIARTARVSPGTFYEIYASKEECFLAAFDADVEVAREAFEQQLDRDQPWPDMIAQGLKIFLDLVFEDPERAKLSLVAAQSAGADAFTRYQQALEQAARVLREGRSLSPSAERLPDGLEVAIAGGIAWLVHQRLAADELEQLKELLPEIIQLTLTPYVGEEEARRAARDCGSRRPPGSDSVARSRVGRS